MPNYPQNSEEFKIMIENYKHQNPVKYAQKREALEKKLAVMEAAEAPVVEPVAVETEEVVDKKPKSIGRKVKENV